MIKKLKLKSEFTNNVLTLMTGTTIAQTISIAISPILTRIYTPEDFGIFALFTSIVAILTLLATGRYELAIMLPRSDRDARNILFLSLIIAIFISFLTMLVVFFFAENIVQFINAPELLVWIYCIPLLVILLALFQSLTVWHSRKKMFKEISYNKVSRSLSTGAVQLSLGSMILGSIGLIIGSIVGYTVATFLLLKSYFKEDTKGLTDINIKRIHILVKKHKKLPLYNLPNAFVDGVRLLGIDLLIAKFFSSATLGQFSLAWRIVQAPLSLIGSSISPVLYQKISSVHKSELNTIIKKFILKASILALPIFLVIYYLAEYIFAFVFGEAWKEAGVAASIMTPWLFLNFITSPLSSIFIVINKQDFMLVFAVFYMIVPLAIIYLFHAEGFLETLQNITYAMGFMLILFISSLLYFTNKLKKEL